MKTRPVGQGYLPRLFIMFQDAIANGTLKPGGHDCEGTAGNTGIGLALVGASMAIKPSFVIPETQSQEKKDMLRLAVRAGAGASRAVSQPQQLRALSERPCNEAVARTDRTKRDLGPTSLTNVANRQPHI